MRELRNFRHVWFRVPWTMQLNDLSRKLGVIESAVPLIQIFESFGIEVSRGIHTRRIFQIAVNVCFGVQKIA